MAINLSNVNISIRQFQKIASGEYNAGEVKLTSENTIGKVNAHVHRKWLNKTDTSHEEVLAVKTAFVRALQSNGVNGDELARVRVQLGLAPEQGDAVDSTLHERSMKPLTRQQVREILDRNAATINSAQPAHGDRVFIVSTTLSKGVDAQETDRDTLRNETNASLDNTRTVSSNHDVQLFERLITGNFEGLHKKDVPRLLAMTREKLAAIREKVGDNPPADDHPYIGLELPGGQFVKFQAQGSSAELLAQLEDAEFFLANYPFPREDGTVPPMPHDKWNNEVKKALTEANKEKPLPHEVRQLEKTILDEARKKFGVDVIPQDARINRIFGSKIYEELDRLADEAGNARRIHMDDLRSVFRTWIASYGAQVIATRRLAETAASLGLPLHPGLYAESLRKGDALLKRNPALADAIARAKTPEEISRAFDDFKPALEKMVRIGSKLDSVCPSLPERIANAFSQKLGLPAPVVEQLNCVRGCVHSCEFFADSLALGKVPCETPEEAEAAINAQIDDFVRARADALAKVDTFGLDEDSADDLKSAIILAQSIKPKVFDLDKFSSIANDIKPALATLKGALNAPGRTKAAGINALKTFTAALKAAVEKKIGYLETDEIYTASHFILTIALKDDKSPAETASAFIGSLAPDDFDDMGAVLARAIFNLVIPNVQNVNQALAQSLGLPNLPPLHAAALIRAGRDMGLTALSEADLLALFDPAKPAGKALADTIKHSPVAVTPKMLESFAVGALRPYEQAIHDGVATAELTNPIVE